MAFLIQLALQLPFTPSFTAPLGLALAFGPVAIREPLLNELSKILTEQNIGRLISALKWLTIIGVAKNVNARLNQWALNNWKWSADKKKWDWKNEVVVITGGSSGIGLETVKKLLPMGMKVAVFDIQPLPKEFEGYANVQYIYCDMTDRSSVAEAANQLRLRWGDPSVLINNAGVGFANSILAVPDEVLTKMFTINIISHFCEGTVKEFMPSMLLKNKGQIIEIASMASFASAPRLVDYSSTKAAVMAFYEGLNMELRHTYKKPGVIATIIHPTWTRTPLTIGHADKIEKSQGKMLEPTQIAQGIVDQILSCRGGQVFMPGHMSVASTLRGEPNWLQDFLRDLQFGGEGPFGLAP